MKYHTPVLLQEIVDYLDPTNGKKFIDATVGGGGHAIALLEAGASVLGIDRDPEAILYIQDQIRNSLFDSKLAQSEQFEIRNLSDLILERANFSNIGEIARRHGFIRIDGILFDLGVSSHQLENAKRGFSFQLEGPLDMRMDPNLTIKAYDIVNNFEKRRLNEIFETYGQEKFSWRIAGAICSARQIKPIQTTSELTQIIEEAVPGKRGKIAKATRSFQALRIVVNSELLNLEQALPQTVDLLKIGGRLAIVSFHSLEDAIVKRFFKQEKRLKVLTKKPIGPKIFEIVKNSRSRSAKLRVAEKI